MKIKIIINSTEALNNTYILVVRGDKITLGHK